MTTNPDPVHESVRLDHSCLDFVDSGVLLAGYHPICKNCGWAEGTHHAWEKPFPTPSLGPGWSCRRCGRTAYTKNGRCTDQEPPTDYPPCSTWQSTTDTD